MRVKIQPVDSTNVFDVDPDYNASIENVKLLISLKIPEYEPAKTTLMLKDQSLKDHQTLDKLGVQDGDTLGLRRGGNTTGCCRIL